ncbi:MAG: glutamate 5-kinase [Synergistaceae bacterium]|jgi:glutamate 5-kinase|nr:glutamate 5-kinase [Synergistaceae bacterium]
MRREDLKRAVRIVIKIGTSSLTFPNGKICANKIDKLAASIADISNSGRRPILISSGAVAAGMGRMGCPPPSNLPEKQALAAVGQGLLMQMYEKYFAEYSQCVGQMLLTRDCFSEPSRYLYSRNTLFSLLNYGVIPVINENDTVAVEELRFGDNDTLSAMVACIADADLLIILSDIDGLYDSDPSLHENARLIPEVLRITEEMEKNSTTRGSSISSGGMYTKLAAARITMANGIPMIIANSSIDSVLLRLLDGEDIGTVFQPRRGSYAGKLRQWLAVGSSAKGAIVIDEGAEEAILHRGTNLLPSGAVEIDGNFSTGDVVSVLNALGEEIARGVSNFDVDDARKIIGRRTSEIKNILGRTDYEELINRYNMAILA